MKILLITALFFLSSCNRLKSESSYVIKYKQQSFSKEEFINRILVRCFSTYGIKCLSFIKKKDIWEKLKSSSLSEALETLFIADLANQKSIFITQESLDEWIEKRSSHIDPVQLEYFLKLSKINVSDWKNLFKDQLLKKIVLESLVKKETATKIKKPKNKPEKKLKYKIAFLKFDSFLDAEKSYKELRSYPNRFEKNLSLAEDLPKSQWVTEEDCPFTDRFKNLSKNSITKPFESEWGHLIVKFLGKKKVSSESKSPLRPYTIESKLYSQKLSEFKKSPELKINYSLYYGLEVR